MNGIIPESDDLSLGAAQGIGIAVTVLAGLSVAVRLTTNWRSGVIEHVGDAISVAALGLIAGTVAAHTMITEKTADPTTPLPSLIQLNHAVNWVASLAMWSSKVPILLLYVQLFGVKKWVKFFSYGLIAATFIIFVTFSGLTSGKCDPDPSELTVEFLTACAKQAADSGFALGLTSVLTDAIIFVLPLHLIIRLNLSTRRKLGLCLVFSTGLIAITVSAISAHYKRRSREGVPSGVIGAMMCTIVECAIALTVGCVPAISGFWTRIIVPSAFFSKISSFSQKSFSRIQPSNASASTRSRRTKASTGSSEHINHDYSHFQKVDSREHQHQHQDVAPPMPVALRDLSQSHSQREVV